MPDALLTGTLVIGLGLLTAIFVLLLRLQAAARRHRIDEATLGAYVGASLRDSGLGEDLGALKQLASDMNKASKDLTSLFEVGRWRGALGEQQLEEILADVVPPDRLLIRRNLTLVGTPDAAIRTRSGYVCIDSKFPFDAYRDFVNGPEAEREARGRAFQRAVRGHLEKVASTYVRPDAGTTPFAVAFIPSEAVYNHVHQTDPRLGREWSQRGVLLASPSTLTTHVALIVAGVRAEALGERVEFVQQALSRLDREFRLVREAWDTLRRHVKNASEQTHRVENALTTLDAAFRSAARLELRDEAPAVLIRET